MIHNPLMMPDGLDACPRPTKQERMSMDESIGKVPSSLPEKVENPEDDGNGPDGSKAPPTKTEDEVWIKFKKNIFVFFLYYF